jgi:hypothetical protein
VKGRRRIENEAREIIRKAWGRIGLRDLRLLCIAARTLSRGDSEETLAEMDEIIADVARRWGITDEAEHEALAEWRAGRAANEQQDNTDG